MHGGSSFIVSHAAMRMAVDYIQANRKALDEFVVAEWAGDIALAYVFQQAGVPLTASWPIYKPHYIGILDFGLQYEDKRFWCYPVGSFHHMTPDVVGEMWDYEQKWIKEENSVSVSELSLRDITTNPSTHKRTTWTHSSATQISSTNSSCRSYAYHATTGTTRAPRSSPVAR